MTIGTGADDGQPGEADEVEIDVEHVRGGSADDRLTAGTGRARLVGGDGADVLRGSAENDVLTGVQGDDELEGGDGSDKLSGGGGDDRLRALDGLRDSVVCGPGADTHESDPIDLVDPSCE